jgi:chaperonin GroES
MDKTKNHQTTSGLIISTKDKEKPQIAIVVEVCGNSIVKVNDRIVINKYGSTDVKIDGNEYSIVKQSDILAIIEN